MEDNKNKKLVVSFIAISLVMVLLVTGGLSYAYFTWWGTPAAVTAVATGQYPDQCSRQCTVASQQCNLDITYAKMASSAAGTNYTATCYINVGVRGLAQQDKATYGVTFYAGSTSAASVSGYTWDNLEASYTPNIRVNPAAAETNLWSATTTGVPLRASHDLVVAGTAGTCNSTYTYENTTVQIKFKNLDKNQTGIIASNQGTVWQYYLTTTAFSCNIQ